MHLLGDVLRWLERSPAITLTPTPLPGTLIGEAISVKLIWAYLLPQGVVSYSSYKLAEALGLSQPSATFGLARLRQLELTHTLGEHRARVRAVYRAVEPGETPETPKPNVRAPDAPRDPPHLGEALKGEAPTTRLVYSYLEPYGEVEVLVRLLEELLGVSHRNAAEALARLAQLNLLERLEQPGNRPGRWRVNA